MRYENYQKRIAKIADVLRIILRMWPLVLLRLVMVVAAVSAFIVAKGAIISVDCAPTASYGDKIDCRAIAFFSKTHLEYRDGSGEWSENAPVMPGDYELRVVGKGFFGKKTSDPVSFTIKNRKITIRSSDGTVDYGENPILSADLAYKDVLCCDDFEMGDVFIKNDGSGLYVAAKPEKNSIVIRNAEGKDVTSAYDISVNREELRIIPREITVTVENASKIYDGKVFSFDGYELSGGTLAGGDSLFAYFTQRIINAGSVENTPRLVLMNENGMDVTLCYNITVVKGMLTVEKRPLIISTDSGEIDYDGTPHTFNNYEISTDTPLAEGQILSVFWSGITDAGDHKNLPTLVTVTADDDVDVTNNYSIFFEAGTLKIKPLPITVSTMDAKALYRGTEYKFSTFGFAVEQGNTVSWHSIGAFGSSSATDVGIYENDTEIRIYDEANDRDVTHNYDITYIRGSIEIMKLPITIMTLSDEWTYDGANHFNETFDFTNIGYNDRIIVTERTTVVDAGTYQNQLSVKIVRDTQTQGGGPSTPDAEEEYVDVSHNYSISFHYGTLTVNKRPITVKPADLTKIYDAVPLTSSVSEISDKSERDLVSGHTLYSVQTSGSITDVGTVTNYIIPSTVVIHDAEGKDVSSNYEMSLSVGVLTVTPREVLVQTGGSTKKYDGTALTNDHFYIADESPNVLIEGHILNVRNIGSLSRVGKTENICSLDETKIYDASGKDVTKNYRVKYSYGILEVYGEPDGNLASGGFNESGSIGSFRSELVAQKDGITVVPPSLLSVKDERNGYIYLRLKSFGGYTGSGWNEATEYPEKLFGQYSANYLTALALGQDMGRLTVNAKDPLFFMPYYTSMHETASHTVQTSDVIYNGREGSVYSVSYADYDYRSPLVLPDGYADFEKAYRSFVYSQYLVIDDETRAYMDNIIDEQKLFGSDMETILRVARYVQNSAKYKIDYNEALDGEENIAIAFLESYREGISQHFATVATLLYRAMGIPARYTVGYATSTAKDEWVEVDRSKVHAWVEVYIDGAGWIEIEATGGDGFGLNGSGGKPQKQTITVKPAYQYKKYDGRTLKAKPTLEYDELLYELLSKGYRCSVSVSGEIDSTGKGESIPTGFKLFDPNGKDITDEYNIVYKNGSLEIIAPDVVLIEVGIAKLQKYYDGTPITVEKADYKIIDSSLRDSFEVEVDISLTEAGCLTLSDLNENPEKYARVVKSTMPGSRIVFVEYSEPPFPEGIIISLTPFLDPIIKVDKKPITVTASSASKAFDGAPLTSDTAYISKGSLCEGHTMTATVSGSIERVGTEINVITKVVITNELGEDVTHNYDITKVNGLLTVYN